MPVGAKVGLTEGIGEGVPVGPPMVGEGTISIPVGPGGTTLGAFVGVPVGPDGVRVIFVESEMVGVGQFGPAQAEIGVIFGESDMAAVGQAFPIQVGALVGAVARLKHVVMHFCAGVGLFTDTVTPI